MTDLSHTPKRVHLISNAHLDPIWQWQWEEGAVEAVATFRVAATFLRRFPEYRFVHNESLLYEWVEQYDPALFAEIAAYIRAGRWVVVGGWYVQPDCNLPGGESFVRQALIGKRYFMEKFGVEPLVGYNVDSFGHHGGLPQMLRKAGYQYYLHFRPTKDDEPGLPIGPYRWQGVDGSEIIASRPALGHYVTYRQHLQEKLHTSIAFVAEHGREAMAFWGVGDHGGGATYDDLLMIRDLIAATTEVEVVHSDPETYFRSLPQQEIDGLPVHTGDLQRCFTGCYTSASRIKRAHRQAEGLLAQAERLATLAAHAAQAPYPAETLTRAWKALLFNQFHDVLAGSSSEAGTQDGMDLFAHCTTLAREVRLQAAMALARLAPPEREGMPVYLFNTQSSPYRGPVTVDFMADYRPNRDGRWYCEVVDPHGAVIPSQEGTPTAILQFDWRKRVTFQAEIPPLTFARYTVRVLPQPGTTYEDMAVREDDAMLTVETGAIRAVFDRETGSLRHLVETATGRDYLVGNGIELLVVDDPGDAWGAGVSAFRDVVGRFTGADGTTLARVAGYHQPGESPISRVRVVERGPVRTVVETVQAYGHSVAILQWILTKGSREVEVQLRLHCQEPRRMLKLAVPTPLHEATARCEIPYGAIARPADGSEQVGQRWTVLEQGEIAVGVVNTGQYGFDACDGELRLSLLRSPAYCHERGHILESDRAHPFMDLGEHTLTVGLVVGDRETVLPGVVCAAHRLNVPVVVLPHLPIGPGNPKADDPGAIPASFLQVTPETVVLGALKVAEDGAGYIVRLHETQGQHTPVEMFCALGEQRLSFLMSPYELKSFRLLPDGRIDEVDLLERSLIMQPLPSTEGLSC